MNANNNIFTHVDKNNDGNSTSINTGQQREQNKREKNNHERWVAHNWVSGQKSAVWRTCY